MSGPVRARWRLQTPTTGAGGIAAILISGDVDGALASLGIGTARAGQLAVRDFCGIDRGIVARWTESSAHLMPHGGAAVTRELMAALVRAGLEEGDADPLETYPEARDIVEARMLAALAEAHSPLAVDLLLDQVERWKGLDEDHVDTAPAELNRLIDPPMVVAVGAPNVGKSTLLNVLAGRGVAIVSDEPGTTRDHVGAMVDVKGLVVRFVDTPGRRAGADALEKRAVEMSSSVVRGADLVLSCLDGSSRGVEQDWEGETMRVGLRCDLGAPCEAVDVRVSARTGEGMEALASAIRARLVPDAALEDPRPWRFWERAGITR